MVHHPCDIHLDGIWMAHGFRQGVISPPMPISTAASDIRPSRVNLDALRGLHRVDRLRRGARFPQGRHMNPSTAATAKGLLIAEAGCALAELDELTRTRTKSRLSRLGKERIRKSGRAIRATIIPGYV